MINNEYKTMKILVVGGAGYIGSHMCKYLAGKGYTPIVLDNLIYGHREAVKWGSFIEGDRCKIKIFSVSFLMNIELKP